jgi:hypothetical protein
MVSISGQPAPTAVCPLDHEYLDYIRQYVETVARTGVESILLDDDLRYVGHGAGPALMDELFCFCEEHIDRFNERDRSSMTREGLLEIFKKPSPITGEDERINRNWYSFMRETMEDFACCIGKAARQVNPEVQVGLCLCGVVAAQLSGRDSQKLLLALAQGGRPWARPGRGGYDDVQRLGDMNIGGYLFQRELLSAQTRVIAENSLWPGTRFSKSPRAWMRQMAMDVFLVFEELFIFDDGFLAEDPRYAEMMAQVRPYLEELSLRVDKESQLVGVGVVMGEEAARYQGDGDKDLLAPLNAYMLLSRLGIPARVVDARRIENEEGPFLMTGNTPLLIAEDLWQTVLEKGVLMDADAIQSLRGAGWKQFEGSSPGETLADVAFEVLEDHPLNGSAKGGKHDWQSSAVASFCKLNVGQGWQVLSTLKDGLDHPLSPSLAIKEDKNHRMGIWACPASDAGWSLSFLRKEQLENTFAWLKGRDLPVRLKGSADIHVICREADNELAVALFNFSTGYSDGVSMLVNPKYRTHSVCVMGSEEKEPSFREVTPLSKGDDCVIELEGSLAVSPFGWEVFVFSAG